MTETCEKCGGEFGVGQWPFCHGDPKEHGIPQGMLGQFAERWDEHIAPPPSEMFNPLSRPDYDPRRGWRIGTLADQKRLMKLNRVEHKN